MVTTTKLLLLLCGILPLALAATTIPEIEEGKPSHGRLTFLPRLKLLIFTSSLLFIGYDKVTCGSTIKLANKVTNYRLHSHGVSYGSGSGQQSVTGFSERDDPNSFWMIRAAHSMQCIRG